MKLNKEFKGILFYGFGGHARSVADVAIANGVKSIIFVDTNAVEGETFAGFPVAKEFPLNLNNDWIAFPASGNALKRKEQLNDIKIKGWRTSSIVSATSTISSISDIGDACFIGHHAHIGPNVKLGNSCIVNTGAIIEHDCTIGDFTHVSVNATISGGCNIGKLCFIGASATVKNNITLDDNITLGAAGCFVKDVLKSGVYIGVPARELK